MTRYHTQTLIGLINRKDAFEFTKFANENGLVVEIAKSRPSFGNREFANVYIDNEHYDVAPERVKAVTDWAIMLGWFVPEPGQSLADIFGLDETLRQELATQMG